MAFKKGHIPWNKGLTIDDPRVRTIIESKNATMIKKYGSLSMTNFDCTPRFTKEHRKKMSDAAKAKWKRPEYRNRIGKAISEGQKNSELFKESHKDIGKKIWANPKHHEWFIKYHLKKLVAGWKNSPKWRAAVTSEEYRQKLREKSEQMWNDTEFRKHFRKHTLPKLTSGRKKSKKWKKSVTSERYRKKIGENSKRLWKNPEYRDKVVSRAMRAVTIKPNKPEKQLLKLLNRLMPKEYKYVGDGSFVLGGRCPDFMNVNGQKKLIELFGDYWHKGEDPDKRVRFFKKFGFNTLVVWEHELQDFPSLETRLLTFNENSLTVGGIS